MNKVAACQHCNNTKGPMTVWEWHELRGDPEKCQEVRRVIDHVLNPQVRGWIA